MGMAEELVENEIRTPLTRHDPGAGRLSVYERRFDLRWADVDQNAHLRHTAYLDYATQARMDCLCDCGVSLADFQAANCGPILLVETARYLREIGPQQRICVRVELTGLSADGRHFAMRNRLYRQDGELAAIVDVHGAWLDLVRRRLMSAPDWLVTAMSRMPRAADWAELAA
jgi:acyl-CoA thioester hydrolase